MTDATLDAAVGALESAGFSALVWDSRFRVVGITEEALRILRLGSAGLAPPLGRHIFSPEWVTLMERSEGGVTLECQRAVMRQMAPALVALDDAYGSVDPRLHDLLDGIAPASIPPLLSARIHVKFGDRTTPLDVLVATLRDNDGTLVGGTTISKPGVGGAALAMLATGDAALFDRMLRFLEPARRAAAILFADLESSTPLGRRLSTHSYFALLRRLFWRVDRSVVGAGGIVGSHVGDGVSAYFLADDAGSDSRAARACIEASKALRADAAEAAERSRL